MSKLRITEDDILEAIHDGAASYAEIGERFGVSRQHINVKFKRFGLHPVASCAWPPHGDSLYRLNRGICTRPGCRDWANPNLSQAYCTEHALYERARTKERAARREKQKVEA